MLRAEPFDRLQLTPIGHICKVFKVVLLVVGHDARLLGWRELRFLGGELLIEIRNVLHMALKK